MPKEVAASGEAADANEERGRPPIDPYRSTIYQEFAARARALLKRRRDARDPATISLVNEVYGGILKCDQKGALPAFEDPAELLKYLVRSMRNHLVNRAAARMAARRPPDERREGWPESQAFPASCHSPGDVLDVHEALDKLARRDPRAAQVVELIFFGGLSQVDAAEALGVKPRDIRSDWEFARAWLKDRLTST